ncbi:hypothetical protein D3C81_2297810 [compost metagenome]
MALLHFGKIFAHHINRRFVHDTLQLGTGEPVGFLGDFVQINTGMQRLILGM